MTSTSTLQPAESNKTVRFKLPQNETLVRTGIILAEDTLWAAIYSAYTRDFYNIRDPIEKQKQVAVIKSQVFTHVKNRRIHDAWEAIGNNSLVTDPRFVLPSSLRPYEKIYPLLPQMISYEKVCELDTVDDIISAYKQMDVWTELNDSKRKEKVMEAIDRFYGNIFHIDLDDPIVAVRGLSSMLQCDIYVIDYMGSLIQHCQRKGNENSIVVLQVNPDRYEIVGIQDNPPDTKIRRLFHQSSDTLIQQLRKVI